MTEHEKKDRFITNHDKYLQGTNETHHTFNKYSSRSLTLPRNQKQRGQWKRLKKLNDRVMKEHLTNKERWAIQIFNHFKRFIAQLNLPLTPTHFMSKARAYYDYTNHAKERFTNESALALLVIYAKAERSLFIRRTKLFQLLHFNKHLFNRYKYIILQNDEKVYETLRDPAFRLGYIRNILLSFFNQHETDLPSLKLIKLSNYLLSKLKDTEFFDTSLDRIIAGTVAYLCIKKLRLENLRQLNLFHFFDVSYYGVTSRVIWTDSLEDLQELLF